MNMRTPVNTGTLKSALTKIIYKLKEELREEKAEVERLKAEVAILHQYVATSERLRRSLRS